MPSLVTEKAKVMVAEKIKESFQQTTSNHYMFAAEHLPFEDDNNPTIPDNSELYQHYDMARKIIFGKRIEPDDVALAIKYYPWTFGTVYAAYDDQDPDLLNKKFYCVSKEGSQYSVFKCLYNYKDSPSVFQPKLSETHITDDLYRTNDFYIWKLLYTVDETQFSKFIVNNEYFPFFDNPTAKEVAVEGGIHSVVIESGGSGYNAYVSGSFRAISISGNNLIHSIQSDNVLSANTDYYQSCAIYIKSGTGVGQLNQIEEYIVTGSDRRIVVKEPFLVSPDFSSKFDIAPMVQITGDGSGAKAIVTMNTSSNSIHMVQMVDIGQGYTIAKVEIPNPKNFLANNAVARAIIPPRGGHGANLAYELNAKSMVISTQFNGSEGGNIPVSNDYRTTGLIMNPEFANAVITVESVSGIVVGQTVSQTTGFSGRVTAVNLDGDQTIRVTDVKGMANTTVDLVASNSTNSAIATTNITLIDKDLSVFDNRGTFSVEPITPLNQFILDEKVIQDTTGAYGYIHEIGNNVIYLTGIVGDFTVSDFSVGLEEVFRGENSGSAAKITGYNIPDLIRTRGECIYIQTTPPVDRSVDQSERLKIVVEF